MPWFNVDDGFADHPKVIELMDRQRGARAVALWTLAGSWCAKHLTDGRVPRAIVKRLGFSALEADELVSVGLWEVAEGGYQFHEWDRRNQTKEQVEAKRKKNADKVRNWRSNRTDDPVTDPPRNRLRNQVTEEVTHPVSNPAPIQSTPIPSNPNPRGENSAELAVVGPPDESAVRALPKICIELAEVWNRRTAQTLKGAEFLAFLSPLSEAAAREGRPILEVWERTVTAFVADCETRGKPAPVQWLRKQIGQWVAPPSPKHGARRRGPAPLPDRSVYTGIEPDWMRDEPLEKVGTA